MQNVFNARILYIQLGASEMKNLHLPIIIEMDEDGYYIASCPLFKGCHSYGETIDETLKNIREVIDICLEETGGQGTQQVCGIWGTASGLEYLNFL